MLLVVGLGNPGEKYKKTRHNVGFLVLDFLCSGFEYDKYADAFVAKDSVAGKETLFVNRKHL